MKNLFSNPIVILPIIWIIVGIAFAIYKIQSKRRAKKSLNAGHITIVGSSNRRSRMFWLYHLYSTFPLLRKEFARLKKKIRLVYPADEISIRMESTKTMTKGITKGLIVLGVVLALSLINIVFAGQIAYYYLFLGLLLAYRSFRRTIKTRLENAEHFLLKQYADFLFNSLVPAYQKKNGRIDDAISSVLDDLPVMMNLHANKIYDVVTAPHLEDAAAEYSEYSPSPYFTSLVSLIVPIKLHGDKKLDNGKTVFIEGIMNLNRQLNEEILVKKRVDAAFSSLSSIVMMGVFAIQPVYWFFLLFFPGTKSFFSTGAAIACEVAIFAVTFLCDYLIENMKTTVNKDVKEDSIWKKIATLPIVSQVLNVQHKKHFTTFERINKQMIAIGDHTGVHAHMIQCATWACAAFLVVNILFITSVIAKSSAVINDFSSEFDNALTPSEEYNKQMEAIGSEISAIHRKEHLTADDREALKNEIRESSKNTMIKADEYVDPVADKIIERNQKAQNVYFQFWYEFVALLAGAVAFNVPTWLLRFKARQSEMGKEDEVNSFNLLAMIFMNMDGIKVETLLEWMERFSHFFRTAITECIIMYPMGKQKALENLSNFDPMSTYHKFCESLLNIDRVGMKKAFEDIEIQQEFYNDKRKTDNEILITKKKTTASHIAFVPFWATVFLWMAPPMVVYAINLIKQFTTQISQL